MLAAFQTMRLDKKGTDCGSTRYITTVLTKELAQYFQYRYIKGSNGLILLTPENIDKYIGTVIHLRSPMYCKDKKGFCNICAGEYFYKLGVTEIGNMSSKVSSIAMNNSLKAFHDLSIHTKVIDWKKYVK